MKRLILTANSLLPFAALCCCLLWQSNGIAQGSLEEEIDCTKVQIDYINDPNLPREERLRLMDEVFYNSLNKFEYCQSQKEKAKSTGASGSGGGSGQEGSGSAGQGSGTTTAAEGGSVATSTMSGTETPIEYPPAEDSPLGGPGNTAEGQELAEEDMQTGGGLPQSNGKVPDDIPPAANDDALAAQIRYAAENEPDPEKSKKLWNEYRKYKGLSPK